jgi:hypothetical protein
MLCSCAILQEVRDVLLPVENVQRELLLAPVSFTLRLDTTAWEYSYDQIRRQGSWSQTAKRAASFFLTFPAFAEGDLASQARACDLGSPSLDSSGLVASTPPR